MAQQAPRRRDYGSGGVTRRADGRYVGTIEAGWTERGTRRRISVTGKTEAEVKWRPRDRRAQLEQDGHTGVSARATVKTWAEEWLPIVDHGDAAARDSRGSGSDHRDQGPLLDPHQPRLHAGQHGPVGRRAREGRRAPRALLTGPPPGDHTRITRVLPRFCGYADVH